MNCEVRELIYGRNTDGIEDQFVLQCAPLIAGLRISSLFIVRRNNLCRIYGLLRDSAIYYYVLYVTEEKAVVFLCRPERLTVYLGKKQVREFLADREYPVCRLEDILRTLRQRYQDYYRGNREFPHELGLILGYPIEDVKGFIRHKGKDPLYAGYWKVYSDAPAKRELFGMYELAREMLAELLRNGVNIQDIIQNYSGNEWT